MKLKQNLKHLMSRVLSKETGLPNRFVVLNYHTVGGCSAGSIDAALFSEHLKLISSNERYRGVSLGDECRHSKEHISTLITFDDGYLDNYECAAPILQKYSLKGVFFVTSGFVEGVIDISKNFRSYQGLKPMNWDQVGRLHEAGHTIGLHGHTHRAFSQMSAAEALDEMAISADLLKRRTGITVNAFAYPFGQLEHRRPDMLDIATSLGIRYVFSTENRGINKCQYLQFNSSCPIPRLRVDSDDSSLILKDKIDGRWDYIASIQRVRSCFKLKSIRAYRALY